MRTRSTLLIAVALLALPIAARAQDYCDRECGQRTLQRLAAHQEMLSQYEAMDEVLSRENLRDEVDQLKARVDALESRD